MSGSESSTNYFLKFNGRKIALGKSREKNPEPEEFDAKSYAVYLLTEGSITEKRELLSNLKSRLMLKDKVITIEGAVGK